jgi:erythromycin esterase
MGLIMDALDTWIAEAASPLRSIDPLDDDADLGPLADAIGDARLVQLGEASHSAGSGFSAKARVVRFLHERLGFDVLIWEEGIFDLRLAHADLSRGDAPIDVVTRALRPGWAGAAELAPLFARTRASLATTRPLELAGYDARFGADALERLPAWLRGVGGALRDPAHRRAAIALADDVLARHDGIARATEGGIAPSDEQLAGFRDAASRLLDDLATRRDAYERVHGRRETGFAERVIESLRTDGPGRADLVPAMSGAPEAGAAFARFWHDRDLQGARNLRWLLEEGYPGRKAVFWAHNVHVMNAHCAEWFVDIAPDPIPGGMTPVGVPIADWLGDDVYTIGMTHFDGAVGLPGEEPQPIDPAAPGSLEARLHDRGETALFLDLRGTDDTPGHPVRSPLSVRVILPQVATLPDLTRAFDGILHVDLATPVTPAS